MAYQAIPPASSGSSSGGWFTYMANYFGTQTGLSNLTWSVTATEDFARSAFTAATLGAQTGGTGAAVGYIAGGIISQTSPSSGAGFADFSMSGSAGQSTIPNMRTKRWMVAYRVAAATATQANDKVTVGVFGGSNIIGLGWSGAATNWQYCRGTNSTNIADTGKAIDTTGNVYLTVAVGNFDLTNVKYNIDVLGGAALTTAEAVTSLPSAAAYQYSWDEGTGTATKINVDAIIVCAEK